MSHDRGCWKCGRDNWDYASCEDPDCVKRDPVRTDRKVPRDMPKKKKIQDDVRTVDANNIPSFTKETVPLEFGPSYPPAYSANSVQEAYSKTSDGIPWKYAENIILSDMKEYLGKTYTEHYKSMDTEETTIECFDAWIALGDSGPTFRNTALKYLWRYGKKNGKNLDDLRKAMHYVMMLMYVEHYKDEDK